MTNKRIESAVEDLLLRTLSEPLDQEELDRAQATINFARSNAMSEPYEDPGH